MNYKLINEALKDLRNIKLSKVSTFESEDFYEEKGQSEEGERIDIYDLKMDNLYLKVVTSSDSYGNENGVTSIQFVKPITKQVTDYEPIN